jgi:hypothetical protein
MACYRNQDNLSNAIVTAVASQTHSCQQPPRSLIDSKITYMAYNVQILHSQESLNSKSCTALKTTQTRSRIQYSSAKKVPQAFTHSGRVPFQPALFHHLTSSNSIADVAARLQSLKHEPECVDAWPNEVLLMNL